jgi:hypothetical protein
MFTLSKRDARIGTNVKFRNEYHGDDLVQAGDIPISGAYLEPEELGALLQEPRAHSLLFAARPASKLTDPLFKNLAPFRLTTKIESAHVVLFFGTDAQEELRLGVCKLKNITLERKAGGLTELSCLVQATPTIDKRIAKLIEYMDEPIQIEISYEHNAEQPELAMGGEHPADEDDEDDDTPARGRRGSRTGAAVNAR